MKRRALLAVLLGALAFGAFHLQAQQGNSQWVLDWSALTYHMSHPMHDVDGTSNAAKGKGICQAGQCNFLIAVPVKTFTTGDSNRDLHMVEATKGAEFPMVVVRAQFAQSELDAGAIHADLQVQFAGQTAHYQAVPFQRIRKGNEVEITGSIPLTCSDFKIDRPSFLGVPIRNAIPVSVQMNWHQL